MKNKKLLIDGDILIYKVATSGEVATNWGDEMWTLHCDLRKCKAQVDAEIDELGSNLEAEDYVVCLTDTANFRKDILPSYKDNRKSKRKPMVLNALREYVMEKHNGVVWDNLEADDVMGIMSTEPSDEERIIVSIDKDMKTIPGKLSADGVTVQDILPKIADYWHMIQTLTGDKTDNYDGIDGVGIKTAEKLISKYTNLNIKDLWKIVVGLYEKKGYSKEEALQQARVAHICRHGDYNKETGEVKLWTI
jgi:DNA polymerase-1